MGIISGGVVMPSDGISRVIQKAGALAANDFAGQCVVGSQAVNTANGVQYTCTVTNGTTTATWVVVGTQT